MKAKTLLVAAAALAAVTISSQAQVYSQNIVGYVNIAPAVGQFTLIANPLDNGAGNVVSNTLVGAPGGTSIQVWNGSGFDTIQKLAGKWKNLTTSLNADNFQLKPGIGFFITPSSAYTNTFVGSLVVNSGQTVTNVVQVGLQAVGSMIPFADAVTNTATINIVAVGGTGLQKWNVGSQSYTSYQFIAGKWKNLNTSLVETPQIGVAEGFFLSPPVTSNVWVETAP